MQVLGDIHRSGTEVAGVGAVPEDRLAVLVAEAAEASDVVEGHVVVLLEGEVQDPVRPVLLDLPLCRQTNYLDHVQWRVVARMDQQQTVEGHQFLMDVGLLLELRVRDGDVQSLRHI
jgi:hypothetical protein